MSKLTIVMYHYVRDLHCSRFPKIKGLQVDAFKEQVSYLKRHYVPISAYDLMDAIETGSELPSNSVLLTFDDGYIDHFTEVFPILDKENISGCFFPPAKCILENKVLDVNKIHFILASVDDKQALVSSLFRSLEQYRSSFCLKTDTYYWDTYGKPSRYDDAAVVFIKRMLQHELPEKLRNIIVDELFGTFVSRDERSFAKELYMTTEQVACLQRNGMYVGSHGFDHYWLSALSEEKQREEIEQSLLFLQTIGSDTSRWIMCFPYGAYNNSTLTILREKKCVVGLTTKVDIVDFSLESELTLPRLDTNDLPMQSDASINEWTRKVISF